MAQMVRFQQSPRVGVTQPFGFSRESEQLVARKYGYCAYSFQMDGAWRPSCSGFIGELVTSSLLPSAFITATTVIAWWTSSPIYLSRFMTHAPFWDQRSNVDHVC